jgi:hypothetical protein
MVELASQQRGDLLREQTPVRSLSLPPPDTVALIRYVENVRPAFRSRQAPRAERRVQRPCPRSTPMSRLAHHRRGRAAVRFWINPADRRMRAAIGCRIRGGACLARCRRDVCTNASSCPHVLMSSCPHVLMSHKRGPRPGKYYHYVDFNLSTAADGAAAPPARALDLEGCGRRLLPSPFRGCVAPDARYGKLA